MKNSSKNLSAGMFTGIVLCLSSMAESNESPWYSKTVESKSGIFTLTLESTEAEFALNDFRLWQIVLKDSASGEGISPARFVVSGGMPMHGHGLPSQPQVTKHVGGGKYLLEGVRFNMLGKWLFEFEVVTQSGTDTVSFDVVVDY